MTIELDKIDKIIFVVCELTILTALMLSTILSYNVIQTHAYYEATKSLNMISIFLVVALVFYFKYFM